MLTRDRIGAALAVVAAVVGLLLVFGGGREADDDDDDAPGTVPATSQLVPPSGEVGTEPGDGDDDDG